MPEVGNEARLIFLIANERAEQKARTEAMETANNADFMRGYWASFGAYRDEIQELIATLNR